MQNDSEDPSVGDSAAESIHSQCGKISLHKYFLSFFFLYDEFLTIFSCLGFEELPSSVFSFGDLLRYGSEVSDAKEGSVDVSFDYHGKLECSAQDCFPVQTPSASFEEWFPNGQGTSYAERFEMSLLQMPSCSRASSFADIDGNHVLDHGDNLNFDLVNNRTDVQFKKTAEEFDDKSMLATLLLNL